MTMSARTATTVKARRPGKTAAAGIAIEPIDCPDRAQQDQGLAADDLRDLMRTVTDAAERLQTTHVALQREVSRLQRELAEANAALRRSQALAALGEMAAGIAHEVRNPLASIQLYANLLAEDLADRPAQQELCSKISCAVTGLDAIVRDVLAFARETTIHPRPTTAGELLDAAIANCQGLLAGRVKVVRSDDACALVLQVDVGLIAQAVSNVIRNAVEAMTEANTAVPRLELSATLKQVRCSGGRQEARVALTVTDNGPGIAPEILARAFNPFFTTRQTGTGLGLAIVHRILDAHGGHINITNVPTGGACVELFLPIQTPAHHINRTRIKFHEQNTCC